MTIASIAIVMVGIVALVVSVLSTDGYAVRHVDLNDGGIWVTSSKDQLFGRLNKPAGSLDAAMNPVSGAGSSAATLDVRQDGAAVVAWDQGAGKLYPVDVTKASIANDHAAPISSAEDVALSGGTLAVLDPASGKIWAQRVDPTLGISDLAGVDPSAKPIATLELATSSNGKNGAALAVGVDGTIFAASSAGRSVSIAQSDSGFQAPRSAQVAAQLTSVQITAVGSQVVIFDADTATLVLPGGKVVRVDGDTAGASLQAPSSSGSSVVIATPKSLLSIDTRSGQSTVLFDHASGRPATPTWLGLCVYAAWAGSPGIFEHACSGAAATAGNVKNISVLSQPVFRVNRQSIVLNDLTTGYVVDVDSGTKVDNWDQVRPPPIADKNTQTQNDNPTPNQQDLPPKPVDDTLGARPGRTTVLHVLDNDSDPQGYILSISAVSDISDAATSAAVSPDGQTIEVTLPENSTGTHFKYTVDDGKGLSESANVDVQARGPSDDTPPNLRVGFVPQPWSIAAGGTLSLPVLGDWRDADGDPVVLTSAIAKVGSVTTTSDGRIAYAAPASAASTSIAYEVSDGFSGAPTVQASIDVTVLDPTSTNTTAATAEPDIARGVVGQPITIHPLDNDLPGADPTDRAAGLTIAGPVASPEGTTVTTDVKSGVVTVVAGRVGSFQLSYSAAFGNAPFSKPQAIRVDAVAPPASDLPPVAMPDSSVLHGQAPNVVDVLANDFDPAGGVLVVQHAAASDPAQLQVAVVQGHWLRINALTPTLTPNPMVVRYTITNGLTAAVSGEVTVTQLAAPLNDTPVPQDDYATVRAGDSVSVPVLDNDTNPGGDPITLVPVVAGAPKPGQLVVTSASGATPDVGSAYVSGPLVRYVAPVSVQSQLSVIVDYVARDPAGDPATGHLHVTVTPAPTATSPDLPPTPQPIEARVVAGDTVKVNIPTYGVDPDGDSVTVTGIGSAPRLGRVTAISPTSITYEAFPTSAGTDSFTYEAVDQFDKSGEATLRIAVVPPGDPQAPVAVDDQLTASPGAHVEADVLTNDIFAADDNVTIATASAGANFPDGVSLASPTGPFKLTAPPDDGKPLVVLYSISDGGVPSIAKLTVRSQADFNNPPRAFDAFAQPSPDATTVQVDVLTKDFDPEGGAVHLTQVAGVPATGDSVSLPVTGHAHSVAYEIADDKGATATAVIHVPGVGAGAPYVKSGQAIAIGKDSTASVRLSDYVADPAGKPVRLTTTDQIAAAPSIGLKAINNGENQLDLTSVAGYVGPAAVSFQVTDGASLDDPTGQRAYLTLLVQVGPATPVIRCPSDPLTLIEGGEAIKIDVASKCHVWVANRADLGSVKFNGDWAKRVDAVTIDGSGSQVLTLTASGASKPGATGEITVSVPNSDATPSKLSIQVAAAPPPTVTPITIDGFKVGATATFNLVDYVKSQLRDPSVNVISISQTAGGAATANYSGSSVSITPGAKTSGVLTFNVVVSDVSDPARVDRHATGAITMNVLNVPDAPTNVTPDRTVLSHVVQLSWTTPANNGAPIDYYTVEGGGTPQQCAASPCTITGLTNGTNYSFTVKAHNVVGDSAPSAPSPTARPDAFPDAVTNLAASNPQDHVVTLTWTAAHVDGTAVVSYHITWGNGGSATVDGTTTTAAASNLVNDNIYTFTVIAVNQLGPGPSASVQGQSAGKPAPPGAPTFTATNDTAGNSRVVVLNWNAVDPNGISPTSYIVNRTGGGSPKTLNCSDDTATTCQDPGVALDGTKYSYSITAKNAAAANDAPSHTSAPGPATTMEATATPDDITNITPNVVSATPDGQVPVTFDVGKSHGASSTVNCTYSGGGCGSGTFPTGGKSGAALTLSFPPRWSGTFTLNDCNGSTQSDSQAGSACNGGTSASAASNGPPNPPGNPRCVSDDGNTANFAWDAPAPIGSRTIANYTWNGASSGSTTGTTAQSPAAVDGPGGQRTINVTAVDSAGETSSSVAATCQDPTPPPPPNPTIFAQNSGVAYPHACSTCYYMKFTLSGNFVSGRYSWQCLDSNDAVLYDSGGGTWQFNAGATYVKGAASPPNAFCWGTPGATEKIRINGVTSNLMTY